MAFHLLLKMTGPCPFPILVRPLKLNFVRLKGLLLKGWRYHFYFGGTYTLKIPPDTANVNGFL